MPRILEMHGFEVEVAGTVPEALSAIQQQKFDVLLADLNVGQPGDGFTIVSAMRRTQPLAVTLILTGYPAFDTALEAIRKQVDGYVVKPAGIEQLLQTITTMLSSPRTHQPVAAQRAPQLLAQHTREISGRWAEAVRRLGTANQPAGSAEMAIDVPRFAHWLGERLAAGVAPASPAELRQAHQLGARRREQGQGVLRLIEECHLLRQEVLQMVEENLLAIEISYVVADLAAINKLIDAMLAAAVEGYLAAPESSRN